MTSMPHRNDDDPPRWRHRPSRRDPTAGRIAAPSRAAAGWLVAVMLVAFNLRPAIVSVPPIVDQIRSAFGLSAAAAGALTAAPVLCMGLFAPAATRVAARWGTGRAMAASLVLLAAATAVRPLGGPALLYAGTLAAGIGIAVGGALLPALVRARFPDRVGPVTGVYTTALIGGALVAAGATEPLRMAVAGSWRAALALWTVPVVAALAVWLAVRPTQVARPVPAGVPPSWSPWRSGPAWLTTAYMGGQSLVYYASIAWLSARYTELGWSAGAGGGLLALFSAAQIVSALGLPALARRDPRPAMVAALGLTTASLAAIAVAPLAAPAAWAILLGLGAGGNFALALTVVGQVAPTPGDTSRASGMAFFVGYLISAVGPVAVGVAHDRTGGYRWPYLALAVVALFTLVAGVLAGGAVRRQHRTTPG